MPDSTDIYKFAANPIVISRDTPPQPTDGAVRGIAYRLTLGAHEYRGRYFPPLRVNVSEMAQAFTSEIAAPASSMRRIGPVVMIEGEADLESRKLRFYDGDASDPIYTATILPGGVSKQNYRAYAEAGSDAWASRYLNYKGCFFLTGRASDWRINIPETEISHLYFVNAVPCLTMILSDMVSGASISCTLTERGIYALDLRILRRMIFDESGVIASVIDVATSVSNETPASACRITVTDVQPSYEQYRIRWRTSLGVLDEMVFYGHAALSPLGDTGDDDGTYLTHDDLTYSWTRRRDRTVYTAGLKMNTGPRPPEDLPLLLDMIASDQVYIVTGAGHQLRVIPATEDLSLEAMPTHPVDLEITLKFADDDTRSLPEIIDACQSMRQRLHSQEFNDTFN